jgi:hypothetical protein
MTGPHGRNVGGMSDLIGRDAGPRAREAALTLAAVLLAFASAYALRRAEGLSPSVEVLGVALALSLSRMAGRPEHRSARSRLIGILVLPLVAIGASEIGTLLFRHPDLGDVLFVAAVSLTVWARRFGPRVRRIASFAVLPVISVLIVPGVAVTGLGDTGASRWWAALVALIAFGWVTLVRWGAGRMGWMGGPDSVVVPARAGARPRREGEPRLRLAGTTKMAIQMAVALAAAFALGRWLFDPHWGWCVLSAFIVSSGNRGREDVAYKAATRVIGAGVGTLGATLVSGLFPAGDGLAVLLIFVVLALALWLRPLNYAFWAAGMTAALALLYGYYGESGVSMFGSRLAAILLGAGLGLGAAWLLMPIRTTDVIRRDIGAALAALDRLLAALIEDPEAVPAHRLGFRRAVAALEYHRTLLAGIPAPLRRRIDHRPALHALGRMPLPEVGVDPDAVRALRRDLRALRRANADAQLPSSEAWDALVIGAEGLEAESSLVG